MGTIGKLIAMPGRERLLLARALFMVVACRLALLLAPASHLRRLAARPEGKSAALAQFSPSRLVWAVQVASRRLPGATCLTQALALQRLLAKAGHDAEIRIGVAKSEGGGLDSHAWVVCHGRVLVGDDGDLGRYEPILSLGLERP